jgi:hypothetical protein
MNFSSNTPRLHHLATLALCAGTLSAQASCGAASCNLLSDRFAMGTWEHTGWSADVRLEALTQTQLREGTHHLQAADLPAGEEAIERRTANRNLVTTLDYAASPQWSFSLRVPVLHRDHLHDLLDEAGAVTGPERWTFSAVGDVQALARWQAPATGAEFSWALSGGLKLPTGGHTVHNDEGTVAERALQPGTGTTDLVLGASARQVLGLADALNLQLTWTQALNERDGFKPGQRVDLSAGWAHALNHEWSVVLQANLSQRGHDSGVNAEPTLSGATTLSLSPGVSVALGHGDTAYAFVQLPVYQKVTGIQLVPQYSLALGWTHSF